MLVDVVEVNAEGGEFGKNQVEQASEEEAYEETDNYDEEPLQIEVCANSHWLGKEERINHWTVDNQASVNKEAAYEKAGC